MKKFLKITMDILIILIAIVLVPKVADVEFKNKLAESIWGGAFVFVVALCFIWAILVIVCDFKERIKYEKKTVLNMVILYVFLIICNIIREQEVLVALNQALIVITLFGVFNYVFSIDRRDKVMINSNYNLRPCKKEDADFIYELKKEGFEWYLKDIKGWDEAEQKDIIKKEMNEHLKDMNIVRYDFEDVGLFTYYEDENKDIFIDMIVLKPIARRRGIGSNLLQYLIANNPHKRLYLRTYKENPARELYIRHGFSKYEEEENYWWMERKSI